MHPGDIVAERFEIERFAGAGGHGTVYAAKDLHAGERVALKMLYTGDAERNARFAREALVLCELAHPGIVRYVAHGIAPPSEAFLAMEWLEGESLAARLSRSGLSVADTVTLGTRIAEALTAAHKRGVVHRDLKPSNLFLPAGDVRRVKLLDFGIARFAGLGRQQITLTGAMLGTPGYIAPEQARGQRDVDPRADVFALGCVLFKCLTGQAPFEGEDVLAVLLKVVIEEAPRVRELRPDVPEDLDDLVARMMSKAPSDRPADAAAVAAHLRGLSDVTGGPPPPVSAASPALGAAEQRVMCLVLARPSGGLAGPTIPAPAPTPSLRSNELAAPTTEEDAPPTMTMTQTGLGTMPIWQDTERDRALEDIVGRYQGRLDRMADGSLVVRLGGADAPQGAPESGAPHAPRRPPPHGEAATDQAVRGARCALALRGLLGDVPMALVAGRGVLRGRPIGAVIERAVRLLAASAEEWAEPVVRLDEVAAGLLGARFDVGGDAAGLTLRGERDTVEGARTLLGKPTPCVGRDREIATLRAFYDECASEPIARCVLITAAAGVGKSRLRYEFLRTLHERAGPGPEIWMGRGDPMSAGSPFAMLAQSIRRAAGLLEGEPLAVRQQKLRARVGRHLDGRDRTRVTQFLGELCGAPFEEASGDTSVTLRAARQDPIVMGDQMLRAWEDWLKAECAAQPVVLVLEDLHWGDLPTVKFVDAALRNLSASPLLVLAFARFEVHELFPKLWEERGLQEIRLVELSRKGSERLVREVLGDEVDDATVAHLAQRAAGNAFYLEELIRAVAEGKGDELPETVLAMVQARLEGLEPDARRLLRGASVFGQVFWEGGITALLGGEGRAVHIGEWLAVLVDREVISLRGAGKFPAEQEYVFRHALVREAAYAMLTEGDRGLGHRLAGEWLEGVGERDALLLAEHFERGGQAARAVTWYRRAVSQALEGNDLEAAASRATRGAACGAEGALLGELRLLEAEAHRWLGAFSDAERCAHAAMKLLPQGSDPYHAALGEAVLAAGRLGHSDKLEVLVRSLGSTPRAGATPSGVYLVTLAQAAGVLFFFGRHDLAEPLFVELDALEPESIADEQPGVIAWIHRARAVRALQGGDAGEYLRLMESTTESFDRAGDIRSACGQRVNVGYAYMGLGGYREAERALRDALMAAERMGLHNVTATARNNLGLALARSGAVDEGRRVELEAIRAATEQGDKRMEGASRAYLAMILVLARQLDGAEREARAAVEILAVAPPARAYALATLVQVLLAQRVQAASRDHVRGLRPPRPPDPGTGARGGAMGTEALGLACEAMALLESLGSLEEGETLVRLVHAEALEATGNLGAARTAIGTARAKLIARAGKIKDLGWRQSFLERVPEHARTIELAATWSGG